MNYKLLLITLLLFSCKNKEQMKEVNKNEKIKNYVNAINCIEVPEGSEEVALNIRDVYINYFKKKTGFVSSTFYKSIKSDGQFNYINIVVWDSHESFTAVVNEGFDNKEGLNIDNMKVLGKGFPSPIKVSPNQYQIIRSD